MKANENTLNEIRNMIDEATTYFVSQLKEVRYNAYDYSKASGNDYSGALYNPCEILNPTTNKSIYLEMADDMQYIYIFRFVKEKGYEMLNFIHLKDYKKTSLFARVAIEVDRILSER